METNSKKYKLTNLKMNHNGHTLYRIEAVKDFTDVHVGDLGGWVESEYNLSQEGDCWIYDNGNVYDKAFVVGSSKVYDNAEVFGYAKLYGNAKVYDNAKIFNAEIYDNAEVYGNAWVHDNAWIGGIAKVCGDACVCDNADIIGDALVETSEDYVVFKNYWSSGRYFTWTKSNNMWSVGCFYGTGEELIKKAYKDSDISGYWYKDAVDTINSKNSEKSLFRRLLSKIFH